MSKKEKNTRTVSALNTVLVIGGGASGLMAAIMAARGGASVTLLEQNEKNGKKINATGNGRCNFTNSYWDSTVMRGSNPSFANSALSQFGWQDAVAFFRDLGIEPVDRNGYYYPRSNQASAVSDLLTLEAQSLGVKMKSRERVVSVQRKGGLWSVQTEGWHYEAEKVILAMGSCASAIKGCDGMGYEIARSLGHSIVKPLPALTGLRLTERDIRFQKWAGVRTEGKVRVIIGGKEAAEARGELQLTDYGISGIPVFQVSRYAIRGLDEKKDVKLLLDFYPDLNQEEFDLFIKRRAERRSNASREQILLGLFPDKLCQVLAAYYERYKKKEILLSVKEGMPFAQAQVVSGGVSTSEVNPDTMESRLAKGIYLTGELLDIDGTCGGYNLQWAWSSGAVAGRHAAEKEHL